jgi:hypothetical protein
MTEKEQPLDMTDAFGLIRSFLSHRAYLAEATGFVGAELARRAVVHDLSKMKDDEFFGFSRINAAARIHKFGSPEYQAGIDAERAVVDLHYLRNSHHPERSKLAGQAAEEARGLPDDATYWEAHGAARMTFLDIIEMVCDWYAAWKGYGDTRSWADSSALNLEKKGEHLSAEQRWLAVEVIVFLSEHAK